jgi:hypothetical protein
VVPLVDDARHVALVDDPALLGEFAPEFDRDLVVVSVRARALPVVVADAVSRTDADRSVATHVEGAFAGHRPSLDGIFFECTLSHIQGLLGSHINVSVRSTVVARRTTTAPQPFAFDEWRRDLSRAGVTATDAPA